MGIQPGDGRIIPVFYFVGSSNMTGTAPVRAAWVMRNGRAVRLIQGAN